MSVPPVAIELLMHCHYSQELPEDTPANKAWVNNFLSMNVIGCAKQSAGGIAPAPPDDFDFYTTTARGRAWVEMICNTPLPIQLWVDPRTQGEKA